MHIIVLITASGRKEASLIARGILKRRLAACVNIIDRIESLFWWKGKIDKGRECLLLVKTRKAQFPRIIKIVKSLHSYEVPEIIAIPVIAGEEKYLNWIDASLR